MDRRNGGFCMPSEKTYRIHINNHPHEIGPAPLPAAQVARMAGVPLDNVVIELETPAGLKEVALEETLAAADGLSRSEERRVGKEGVSTCRSRCSPVN